MLKLIMVIVGMILTVSIQSKADKYCGVDYSKISPAKRIIHMLVYELSGVIIFIISGIIL